MRKGTGIIGDALAPNFNEALANQMGLLARTLDVPVLTCNDLGFLPLKKMGRYTIVNGRFFREGTRVPVLSTLNGAYFYTFLKFFENKFDTLLLSGGIDSGFLSYLDLKKYLLVMNALPFDGGDKQLKNFVTRFAPALRAIVAQSQKVKQKLIDSGVESQKVKVIYPWIDLAKFQVTEPPPLEPFRFIFASAPNLESATEDIFEEKGISLLLEAFKEFSISTPANLTILWRGYYTPALKRKVKELSLEAEVEIINDIVDTSKLFAGCHATVIPYKSIRRSPEIPLSAAESLASGRPVVTTNVPEIAEIIRARGCGCIAEPSRDTFVSALKACHQSYSAYQSESRRVGGELFGLDGIIQLVRSLKKLSG